MPSRTVTFLQPTQITQRAVASLILGASVISSASSQTLELELAGFASEAPMFLAQPSTDFPTYVAGRSGTISILKPDGSFDTVFTITDVDSANEGGLLGIAFHPDFAGNRKLYAHLTVDNGGVTAFNRVSPFSTVIREYTLSADGRSLASGPRPIFSTPQPDDNHNAGSIAFGPYDGYLYIPLGDGGGSRDPFNVGQDTNTFLSSVLRIDVDADDFPDDTQRNYAIPDSNPFTDTTDLDEIFAFGLRNPFRSSFDRFTGHFYIADVGQNAREEISVIPADAQGQPDNSGLNFGWSEREGFIAHQGGTLTPSMTDPIYDYTHGFGTFQGRSVTGGVVYRGPVVAHRGRYLFADFLSNNFWSFDPSDPINTVTRFNVSTDQGFLSSIIAICEDASGDTFVTSIGGAIYKVVGQTGCPGDAERDGDHDADDLNFVLDANPAKIPIADQNADGLLDFFDAALVQNALEQPCP